uniref:Uncharacterized protein n=1 Tax=Glossina brevipalpis TaxID=37001 RepID=A0A1A9W7U6_9MUSC
MFHAIANDDNFEDDYVVLVVVVAIANGVLKCIKQDLTYAYVCVNTSITNYMYTESTPTEQKSNFVFINCVNCANRLFLKKFKHKNVSVQLNSVHLVKRCSGRLDIDNNN